MTTSPNKGYNLQATGSNSGTWGTTLNDEVITYLDDNLGGRTSKDLTGLTGGAASFSLTAAESRNAILYLFGTLSANITITTSCIGFFFVENNTSGAFTVTIKNSVAASGSGFTSTVAVVPQKSRVSLMSDNSQGVRIAGQNGFEKGTAPLLAQASAPIGYTISTANTNKALRLVSSGGGSTGGGAGTFTGSFVNLKIARNQLPNVTLTDTTSSTSGGTPRTGIKYNFITFSSGGYPALFLTTSGLGTNFDIVADPLAGHTHAVSIALNGGVTQQDLLDVAYVDVSIYTKD